MKYTGNLSLSKLLKITKQAFKKIPDHRTGNIIYPIEDVLMSGLAMFGLKCPSLLNFDERRREGRVKHNLLKLYGVSQAPSDTQQRSVLDPIHPEEIQKAYKPILKHIEKEGLLSQYEHEGRLLIALDATGEFNSNHIKCPECCTRHHKNGKTEYHHQLLAAVIVHPDKKVVLPITTEAITQQDGQKKNDCEMNAAKRLLPRLRELFAKQKIILLCDALYATGPFIKLLNQNNIDYIIRAKQGKLATLYSNYVQALHTPKVHAKETNEQGYHWIDELPLNKTHADIPVNFLDYWEIKNEKEHNFQWITNLTLSKNNIESVMHAGRTRWKIENETFNTLKNLDYNLGHNCGHGKQHLATNYGLLTFLMFLLDQIQEAACEGFKQARKKTTSRRSLWEKMRILFISYLIDSWDDLWQALIHGYKMDKLIPNTS